MNTFFSTVNFDTFNDILIKVKQSELKIGNIIHLFISTTSHYFINYH